MTYAALRIVDKRIVGHRRRRHVYSRQTNLDSQRMVVLEKGKKHLLAAAFIGVLGRADLVDVRRRCIQCRELACKGGIWVVRRL